MPFLESNLYQSTMPRTLLAVGWGIIMGLFFGVPPAWAAHTMGMPWVPYGAAVITLGLIVGLLIAFTVEALVPREDEPTASLPSNLSNPVSRRAVEDPVARRLAREMASLERLDAEREYRPEPDYAQQIERQIVWKELLELELQDIDEQMSRIRSRSSMKGENDGRRNARTSQPE